MACLLVPAATTIVTTTLRQKFPAELRLDWLNIMLWGGVVMLIVDHVLSGEIIFMPPFFTAGIDKISAELLTVGLPMTLATVFVWAVMVLFSIKFKNKNGQVKLLKFVK